MAYTDQQIAEYARQLGAKGASAAEIEAFVKSAKGSVGPAPSAVPAEDRSVMPDDAAFGAYEEPGIMQRIRESAAVRGLIGPTANQRLRSQAQQEALGTSGSASPMERDGLIPALAQTGRGMAASTARTAGGVVGAPGGALGAGANAAGETVAQLIESGRTDPGRIAQAAILGVPTLGTIVGGVTKMGLAGAGGELARQAVNGEDMDLVRAGTDGITTAALTGIMRAAGAGINKLSSRVDPVEQARVAKIAYDSKPERDRMVDLINSGGSVPPADVRQALGGRSGMVEGFGQSLAGKEFLQQQASMVNEPVLRGMVRQDFRLSPEGRLGPSTVEAIERRAAIPYKEVAAISPDANQAQQEWKRVRDEARRLQYSLDSGAVPPANAVEVREQIKSLGEQRDNLEGLLKAYAATTVDTPQAKGLSGLLQRFNDRTAGAAANKARFDARQTADIQGSILPRSEPLQIGSFKTDRVNLQTPEMAGNPAMRDVLDEADRRLYVQKNRTAASTRRRIDSETAKAGDVPLMRELEDAKVTLAKLNTLTDSGAINEGRETLNPQALAAFKKTTAGERMSGDTLRAALIAETLPKVTQDVSRIGTPNVSRINGVLAGVQGAQALAGADPVKAAGAFVPLLGPKMRDYYLGRGVQEKLVRDLIRGPVARTEMDPAILAIMQRLGANAVTDPANPDAPQIPPAVQAILDRLTR